MTPRDESLVDLLERLGQVTAAAREAVRRRREHDPEADDRLRGLYISETRIDHLLTRPAPAPPDPIELGPTAGSVGVERSGLRLADLSRSAGLTALDETLLLVALAPDVDATIEQVYGYLNDDVSRRRATVGLALELAGVSFASGAARSRLAPGGPLIDQALLLVEDGDRPSLGRSLRVADRVTAHLLGDDTVEVALSRILAPPSPPVGDGEALRRSLDAGVALVYLRDRPGAAARSVASAALTATSRPALHIDLSALDEPDDWPELIIREAALRDATIVAGPIDGLVERHRATLRAIAALPRQTILFGTASWDPAWSEEVALVVDSPPTTRAERSALWRSAFDGADVSAVDVDDAMGSFRLSPDQIARAAQSAVMTARHLDAQMSADLLRSSALGQNATGLGRLARRVQPAYTWTDLVLPADTHRELHDLAARARRREVVLDQWKMRRGGAMGRGVTGLFAGASGTGKTMSAEVVAHDLGLDLYTVDLSTVVDKYIGETEKNLERIFDEAEGVNAVLLFDEADALFGKRSEVRDARDRYANIEVAFLLQRMETFNGLAILATNLKANIDEAFARRLDSVIDFALPGPAERRLLWDAILGSRAPRGPDLDLDFCAESFELAGGSIQSVAVTAAYLAADAGTVIGMTEVVRAVHREFRKLGRLSVPSDFGAWFHLVEVHDHVGASAAKGF